MCVCVCVYVCGDCFVYSNYCPPLSNIGQVCGNMISHKQAIEKMVWFTPLP